MTQEEFNKILAEKEKIIQTMSADNHRLRKQVYRLDHDIVYPADYQKLKKDLKKAKKKIADMQLIIKKGRITNIDYLIEDYIKMSQSKLAVLVREVDLMSFTSATVGNIKQLLDYFSVVTSQLKELVVMHDEGVFRSTLTRQTQIELMAVHSLCGKLLNNNFLEYIEENDVAEFYESLKDLRCFLEKVIKHEEVE